MQTECGAAHIRKPREAPQITQLSAFPPEPLDFACSLSLHSHLEPRPPAPSSPHPNVLCGPLAEHFTCLVDFANFSQSTSSSYTERNRESQRTGTSCPRLQENQNLAKPRGSALCRGGQVLAAPPPHFWVATPSHHLAKCSRLQLWCPRDPSASQAESPCSSQAEEDGTETARWGS